MKHNAAPFAKVVTFKGWLQTSALLTQRCLYIRTQIVGRLTTCCCQSYKSCPLWPHLPLQRCWTLNSYVIYLISVSSAFPFTSACPSVASPPFPVHLVFSFHRQKEILSWNLLFLSITYSSVFQRRLCRVPLWVFFSIIVTVPGPFFKTLSVLFPMLT